MAEYKINNLAAPIDFQTDDIITRTIQNAKNLLMCQMGEVPYDRLRGFDTALYDLPLPLLQNELVPELDRIMAWEPDVEVVDATASLDENGEIYIEATIDVLIREPDAAEEEETA